MIDRQCEEPEYSPEELRRQLRNPQPYRRDWRGNSRPAGQRFSRRPRQYGVLQLPLRKSFGRSVLVEVGSRSRRAVVRVPRGLSVKLGQTKIVIATLARCHNRSDRNCHPAPTFRGMSSTATLQMPVGIATARARGIASRQGSPSRQAALREVDKSAWPRREHIADLPLKCGIQPLVVGRDVTERGILHSDPDGQSRIGILRPEMQDGRLRRLCRTSNTVVNLSNEVGKTRRRELRQRGGVRVGERIALLRCGVRFDNQRPQA